MFEQVLSKDAKKSLAVLGKSGLLKNAYMAGGTALALQIGHRVSVDFDFFTPKEFKMIRDISWEEVKKKIKEEEDKIKAILIQPMLHTKMHCFFSFPFLTLCSIQAIF